MRLLQICRDALGDGALRHALNYTMGGSGTLYIDTAAKR
jgi:hypothetical protein